MISIGIDYGTKNIGMAISDIDGQFAGPLPLLHNHGSATIEEIARICRAKKVERIIIGIPGLDRENEITKTIRKFAQDLGNTLELEVEFWDESYSSVKAESGLRGKRKKSSDSIAARMILQEYLDFNVQR